MLLQSCFLFPVLNIKTIFSKIFSYFFRLLFAFTNIFVFNDDQISEGESFLEKMNHQCHCIVSKNTCFQQIFMGTGKNSNEIFLW